MADAAEAVHLPPPAIIKPTELWTGKQVFTMLLRPSNCSSLQVNLETRNKAYNQASRESPPRSLFPAPFFPALLPARHVPILSPRPFPRMSHPISPPPLHVTDT